METTQAKIKEFLESILKLVNMLFQAQSEDYDLYDDTVRMSFMLAVFVFIVVTVARIKWCQKFVDFTFGGLLAVYRISSLLNSCRMG